YVRFMVHTAKELSSRPRWLYLHGFASGPSSTKATQLAAHYRERGIELERLNLRLPSLEHLRMSAIIRHVKDSIGGPPDPVVLFGSSLGGLSACRVAEDDARVFALVLLAPAFDFVTNLRERYGEKLMRSWKESGFVDIDDYVNKTRARLDYGFYEDCAAID